MLSVPLFKTRRIQQTKDIFYTLVGNDELDETVGEKAYKYLKNDREGIRNLYKLEPSKVKTCTEGQVSHVLSTVGN